MNRIKYISLVVAGCVFVGCGKQQVHDNNLQLLSQEVNAYKISFDKREMGSGALKVNCAFTIEFDAKDSVVLNFGGTLLDDSVAELQVLPSDMEYSFRPDNREIIFYNPGKDRIRVRMKYVYLNLTSVLMYADSGSEIWECIYSNSGEYYYPMKRGNRYSGIVQYFVPDSLLVVSSGKQGHVKCQRIEQCVPLNFAFLDKGIYERQTLHGRHGIQVYQSVRNKAPSARLDELAILSSKAIEWYENKFQEPYIKPIFGTYGYPTFIFHNGNSSFNRYNMGFISASQEKFSTYPDIYPLIHEIGHRWFGEYSMFINDGQKGYAFIIETLNEFMALMCIRDIIGIEEYERVIDNYTERWENIKGSETDIHPIDITENNNIIVTYRKGPVMIDRVAREIGYDKVIRNIISIYRELSGIPDLEFTRIEKILEPEFLEIK